MFKFLWLCKQRPRFAQGQPKGYVQMKELDRTTETIVPMNKMWRKLNANIQHCSLSAVQRKTAFVEQSWCPEFDMFGSMPWCSFPWHKLLAGAKELLYNSLNLFHEFTSLFSLKVIFAGLLRKAFPQKHAFVDISVFLWFRKQQPRFVQGQPKAQFAEFNVPTCGKIAVWQLSRERQPLWNSHDVLNLTCLDQCHGVPSHGTSSWLARKNCHTTVWIWSMSLYREGAFYRFAEDGLPMKAGLCRHQCFSVFAQATAKIRSRPARGLFSNERTW